MVLSIHLYASIVLSAFAIVSFAIAYVSKRQMRQAIRLEHRIEHAVRMTSQDARNKSQSHVESRVGISPVKHTLRMWSDARDPYHSYVTFAEGERESLPFSYSWFYGTTAPAKIVRAMRSIIDAHPPLMTLLGIIGGVAIVTLSFLSFQLFGLSGYLFLIGLYGSVLIIWKLNVFEVALYLSAVSRVGIEALDSTDSLYIREIERVLKGDMRSYLLMGLSFLSGATIAALLASGSLT